MKTTKGGRSPLPPTLDDAVTGLTDTVGDALEGVAPGAGAPVAEPGSQPLDAIRR